jgi:hypothetical protein
VLVGSQQPAGLRKAPCLDYNRSTFFPGLVTCHTDHEKWYDKVIEQIKRPFQWAQRAWDKYGEYAMYAAAAAIAAPAVMAAASNIAGGISSALTSSGATSAGTAAAAEPGLLSTIQTVVSGVGTEGISTQGLIGVLGEQVAVLTGLPIDQAIALVAPIVGDQLDAKLKQAIASSLLPEPDMPAGPTKAERLFDKALPLVHRALETGEAGYAQVALDALGGVLIAAREEGNTEIEEQVTQLTKKLAPLIQVKKSEFPIVPVVIGGGAVLIALAVMMKGKS